MCLEALFGGGDDMEAIARENLELARQQANDALKAQEDAKRQQIAAADTESEAARMAEEERMRQLLAAGSFGATFDAAPSAPAPLGYRTAFGG